MSNGIYDTQELLIDEALEHWDMEHLDSLHWQLYSGRPLFDEDLNPNAVVSNTMLDRLRSAGLALLPGEPVSPEEQPVSPEVERRHRMGPKRSRFRRSKIDQSQENVYVRRVGKPTLNGDLEGHWIGNRNLPGWHMVQAELDAGPNDSSSPVLLHPRLAELHENIVRSCAPIVGRRLGQAWYPIGGAGESTLQPLASTVSNSAPYDQVTSRIGNIVTSDMETICVDVRNVDLPSIIEFRMKNRDQLCSYFDSMTEFVHRMSLYEGDEERFDAALRDRAAEIAEGGAAIRSRSIRHFGVVGASMSVGLSGFGWFLAHDQLPSAIFTLLPSLVPLVELTDPPGEGTAYVTMLGDWRNGVY